jgi:DNA repair protein RadC
MRLTCRDSDIGRVIAHPSDAVSVMLPMMLVDRETLVLMCLDSDRRVISAIVVATGTATQVDFDVEHLFAAARMLGAASILIAHNHPDGNPTPSIPDIETTKVLEQLTPLVGMNFVDHLVLTHTGRYRSIAEFMEKGF